MCIVTAISRPLAAARSTGSLTYSAPAGMRTEVLPLKRRPWSEPATTSDEPGRTARAMLASFTTSISLP